VIWDPSEKSPGQDIGGTLKDARQVALYKRYRYNDYNQILGKQTLDSPPHPELADKTWESSRRQATLVSDSHEYEGLNQAPEGTEWRPPVAEMDAEIAAEVNGPAGYPSSSAESLCCTLRNANTIAPRTSDL